MRWPRHFKPTPWTEKHLDSGLRFHLEQQVEANISAGMSPEEARRQANLELSVSNASRKSAATLAGNIISMFFSKTFSLPSAA